MLIVHSTQFFSFGLALKRNFYFEKTKKKSANKNFSALTKVNCIITRHKVKSLNMKFKEIQKEKKSDNPLRIQ